jgi:hypothetical protein
MHSQAASDGLPEFWLKIIITIIGLGLFNFHL